MRPAEVFGWVHAGVAPGRLARIMCTDSNGDAVHFAATEHRADVSAFVGEGGKFGFRVPLELFDKLDRRVTFTDENGRPLVDGSDLTLPTHSASDSGLDAPLRVFLHIPKTGGTSLRLSLSRVPQMSRLTTAYIYPEHDSLTVQELNQIPLHQRSRYRAVMGHVPFGIGAYFARPCEYITFVREPLDRLRSNFRHYVSRSSHDPSASHFFIQAINDGSIQDFDNVMTRIIAGVDPGAVPLGQIGEKDVELALYNIMRHFRFVGLIGRLDEHLAELGRFMFGNPIRPAFENVAFGPTLEEEKLVDWDRVSDLNRFNQMLYDAILAQQIAGVDLRGHSPRGPRRSWFPRSMRRSWIRSLQPSS